MRSRLFTSPAAWGEASPRTTLLDARPESEFAFSAVVDTNVILDIFSCHDLDATYTRLGAAAAIDDRNARYRRARVRGSMLLAMYLNASRATTYSLHAEAVAKLTEKAPPKDTTSFLPAFTTEIVHFIKDRLFSEWVAGTSKEPETARGDAADELLIAKAKYFGVPVITNEGFKPSGIVDEKMRALAKGAGVVAVTPEEFYAGKLDEATAIADFLARFRQFAPDRIRTGRKHVPRLLSTVFGYYQHVLLGVTKGRALPVSVSI
jgi:hypothetical protein